MDIRGFSRINGLLGGLLDPTKKKATGASADRDSGGQAPPDPRKNIKLSPEQLQEAFEAFLVSLSGSGLSAEQTTTEEGSPNFIVRGPNGNVVRTLSYFAIVDVWLDRKKLNTSTGRLLSRSA
jgi:hypothetical protein